MLIDLTGVSAEGLAPLDPDDYPAVITKSEVKNSKSSDEPTLYLELSVGEEGRNLRWSTSLQGQSLWRLKRLLIRLGIEIPEGPFEFDEADLVGIECVARVIQEPHYKEKNRKTNRIQEILGSDGDSAEESWS
jgi:hypothetical protein